MFFACASSGQARSTGERKGPRYAEKVLAYLEKHYMPDLKSAIVTRESLPRLDFKVGTQCSSRLRVLVGAELLQSAYFRVHNRDRNIRGLYFVGAGTHPGAGIPGVVNSAKATASLILSDMQARVARASQEAKRVSYA